MSPQFNPTARTISTDVLRCYLDSIPPGEAVEVVLAGLVDPELPPGATVITNDVFVFSKTPDSNPDNDSDSEDTLAINCPGPDGDDDCSESYNPDTNDCTANDPAESSCDLDAMFCTADTCDGAGTCVAGGDPCPGTECNMCQEDTDSCFDPSGTACTDDGMFCNGPEECDGSGTCVGTGDPCPGGECNTCQEDTDSCLDPSGTACTDTSPPPTGDCNAAQCDGSGTCNQAFTTEGDGTACGDQTDTDCDNPNTCLSGVCEDNFEIGETSCGAPTCADSCTQKNEDFCDGEGSCSDGGTLDCGAYACVDGGCKVSCDSNADCCATVGYDTCQDGSCCKSDGQTCGSPSECCSGSCSGTCLSES
jgi:hypothetical protein